MFTAKIINKEYVNGALQVTVAFTDGVTTINESCIPQDLNGLKFWVKSRLDTFNSAKQIDSDFSVDDPIEPPTTPTPPTLTPEEQAREAWLLDYTKWVRVKTTLIDTGIFTGSETPAVNLKNKVKNGFLPDYLNYI